MNGLVQIPDGENSKEKVSRTASIYRLLDLLLLTMNITVTQIAEIERWRLTENALTL